MKRTQLVSLAVGLAVITIIAADASAMYSPRLNRFLQRDPGPSSGSPMRSGSAGPVAGGGFAPRDAVNQYTDGMNLYQYQQGNPVGLLDPSGTVVVAIAGWTRPGSDMDAIANRIADGILLLVKKNKIDSKSELAVRIVTDGGGGMKREQTILDEYRAFMDRKKEDHCSLEQFVVVGHSDGATAIYHILKAHGFDGEKQDLFLANELTPAYIGMLDFVRLIYGPLNLDFITANGSADAGESGRTVEKPDNSTLINLAQNKGILKGRYVHGADENHVTSSVGHLNFPKDPGVIEKVAVGAANAYLRRIGYQVGRYPERHAGAGGVVSHSTKKW